MSAHLGAHEVMQLHEVLTSTIDGINQLELYRRHVKDQDLYSILDKQINFMVQEYNTIVQALGEKGVQESIPYRAPKNTSPSYGLRNPQTQSPNLTAEQLDDRDVASGMLGFHKSSAILKTMASLECADQNLRKMLQQGSINCNEMAYEVWQYMNNRGYYQIPTMKQTTTSTMVNAYATSPMGNYNYEI